MSEIYQETAYGLSQPYINVFPTPVVSNRAPTTADKQEIGTLWIFSKTPSGVAQNSAYVITSIISNKANWLLLEASGGSGLFSTLHVTGTSTLDGNVTLSGAANLTMGTGVLTVGTGGIDVTTSGIIATDTGNIQSVSGTIETGSNISAGTSVTAGTFVNAGTYVQAGSNLIAGGAVVAGTGVVTVNGAGASLDTNPGLSLTSALETSLSTGTLSIKAISAGTGNNNGFIQIWIGNGVGQAWIPYFTTINP